MDAGDIAKLRGMLERGESEDTILSYFKVMGIPDEDVLRQIVRIQYRPEKKKETEEAPAKQPHTQPKRKYGSKLPYLILIFFLIGGLVAAYVVFSGPLGEYIQPFLIGHEPRTFTVSVVVQSCAPTHASLKVYNEDISGLPPTTFNIRENNATCVPVTNLQATGIGAIITCTGVFENGTSYMVVSNNTYDDGFWCRY